VSDPFWAIIPAGGSGVRASLGLPKQFYDMGGVTVLERTAMQVLGVPGLSGLVVALPVASGEDQQSSVIEGVRARLGSMSSPRAPVFLVDGGETRQQSVYRALVAVPRDARLIAVHDASRPFISREAFLRVVDAARVNGAAVCGVVPSDTVKAIRTGSAGEALVDTTLNRDSLLSVQTPQVFAAPLLREAHEAAQRDGFAGTDDSSLVERTGHMVAVVPGERTNVKLTYPEDFAAVRTQVTGLGYDVHPLVEGRKCVIGGVDLPADMGLLGHSDADVLCHAVMDAILGALGNGDIGQWFPDSDPRFAGARSVDLLSEMWEQLSPTAEIVNIDAVVIAEAPRIMPRSAEMRRNIADALRCDPRQISVKATTAEGLGAIGRREGIAAYCVATLKKGSGMSYSHGRPNRSSTSGYDS